MLLLFVRANDADKNVILDSVYLVRKIVKLFPCDQFVLIRKITQQNERSMTLLIAVMAIVPYLLCYTLVEENKLDINPAQSVYQQVLQFAKNVMGKLNVGDWLSPMTNGYIGLYDEDSSLQLLDT